MRYRPALARRIPLSLPRSKSDRLGASWTLEGVVWLVICLGILLGFVLLSGCGHVKAVETSLRVDADRCKEAGDKPVDPESTWLDCISGGEVTVRIELPRKAWHDMKAMKHPSPFGPSPGK